jgi:hypothetical protein
MSEFSFNSILYIQTRYFVQPICVVPVIPIESNLYLLFHFHLSDPIFHACIHDVNPAYPLTQTYRWVALMRRWLGFGELADDDMMSASSIDKAASVTAGDCFQPYLTPWLANDPS